MAKDPESCSNLDFGFAFGSLQEVQTLLDTSPSADIVHQSDDDNRTPLHMAVEFDRLDIAELLISRGADVNIRTLELGLASIHLSVRLGSLSMTKLLLNHGADINIRNRIDLCPIHIAISKESVEMVNLLLSKGADPNVVTRDRRTESPLLKAATINQQLTQLLVNSGANISLGLKEILVALLANKPDIADYLLDLVVKKVGDGQKFYKLTPNFIGKSHLQALATNVMNCDPNLAIVIMEKLVKLGGDINYCNHFGCLYHCLVSRTEKDEVSKVLFEKLLTFDDSDCDQFVSINGQSMTPLTYAVTCGQFYFANQLILQGFADVSKVNLDTFRFTPESVDTLKLLFFSGFKFPINFHIQNRPSNENHDLIFAEFCSWIENEFNSVLSLKNLIRIFLRTKYRRKLPQIVNYLQCPDLIVKFLMFN